MRELPRGIQRLVESLTLSPGARVLDYGCADRPYEGLFDGADYVGADLPGNADADVEVRADGSIPLPDESFDVVLSTQVLEHVADPALYLAECHRVLRTGGRLVLTTHGIFVYHPDPVDLWRWTCAGLERAVIDAGFEAPRLEGIIGLTATGIQLTQDAILGRLSSRRLASGLALVAQTLMRWADRWETEESKRLNACVFGIVASKPPST